MAQVFLFNTSSRIILRSPQSAPSFFSFLAGTATVVVSLFVLVALGVYTIFGVSSPVGGSEEVTRLIGQGWERLVGGRLEFITDPETMIQRALAHIDAKRAALGLAKYDPGRWGASGDWRLRELEKLPLAEQRSALYGKMITDRKEQ